jgi:hypothetical protein
MLYSVVGGILFLVGIARHVSLDIDVSLPLLFIV